MSNIIIIIFWYKAAKIDKRREKTHLQNGSKMNANDKVYLMLPLEWLEEENLEETPVAAAEEWW